MLQREHFWLRWRLLTLFIRFKPTSQKPSNGAAETRASEALALSRAGTDGGTSCPRGAIPSQRPVPAWAWAERTERPGRARGEQGKPCLTPWRGERWEPRQAEEGEPLPARPGAGRLPSAPLSPGDEDASAASPVPWQLRLLRPGFRARPGARLGTLGRPGRLRRLPSSAPARPRSDSGRPSPAHRGAGSSCRDRWQWRASQQDLEDREA